MAPSLGALWDGPLGEGPQSSRGATSRRWASCRALQRHAAAHLPHPPHHLGGTGSRREGPGHYSPRRVKWAVGAWLLLCGPGLVFGCDRPQAP